jgi:hypothetical protein
MRLQTARCQNCCEQAAPRWLFAGSYARTFVRPSWTGTSWKGRAGQGPAIRTRQVLDRQGFPMCICIYPSPGGIGSNKQCFHNHYMHTCLLRATKTLFRQEMIPLCYASSCLPLLARQGPSLPVLHLFKRLLVPRNLQAVHPGPSLYHSASPLLPWSLVLSSTALNLPLYIPIDLSLTNRHATQPSQLPLPTSSSLRWAFEPVQQGQ